MICCAISGFSKEDIKQAVNIQIREINQGFLSSLGEKPLGLIFDHIAESRWGIMVLAKDETSGRVVGYVLGTLNSGRLYRDFFARKLPAALFYFLPRLLSFRRMKKAIETLFYPAKKQPELLPAAELLDLAVDSAYQGTGAAGELFSNLADEFNKKGITSFKIPTAESLTRAHRFYEKMGAEKAGSFQLHPGEETVVYVYSQKKSV